jgi:2,4-dienoyl-CoA reductase-like NADH-dependent reductase (Old Yellow Enzyme family)
MCQYLSVDGGPTDWHLVHLGRFAIGGAGIVFCEDCVVQARGRTTHHCAGIYDDALVPRYRRVTDFIRSMGSVPAIQIGHAGSVASSKGPMDGFVPLTADDAARGFPAWRPVAVSEGELGPGRPLPVVLERGDIAGLVRAFAEAARRAADAGYEICEIHGAHGYLIHQFLSAGSNRRSDAYGADLEGRMRFALEVVEAVRAAWPADKPLFFRVSCVEGKGGSWGMTDTLRLCGELLARGVDVIDCSSGGIGGTSAMPAVPRVPGFQVGYADRIRRTLNCLTMAVGMITEGKQAEAILAAGSADLIAVASEMMFDPNWALRAARELGVPDHLDLLPPHHAFRLKRREEMRGAYPPGSAAAIPWEVDEAIPYEWR